MTGSLLAVWSHIEKALSECHKEEDKRIIMKRLEANGKKLIGIQIPDEVRSLSF